MKSTETIFANLYSLLSQAQQLDPVTGQPNGTPAFQTTGRVLPAVANVAQVIQPALFMIEGEEDIEENAQSLAKYDMHAAAVIFFRNTQGPSGIPSQQMNALRDAIVFQMKQRTLASDGVTVVPLAGGLSQTLGGVVYKALFRGRVLKNEGLQNQQGAMVFPISIISGM